MLPIGTITVEVACTAPLMNRRGVRAPFELEVGDQGASQVGVEPDRHRWVQRLEFGASRSPELTLDYAGSRLDASAHGGGRNGGWQRG